ncbi:hypothetical protein ACFVUS_38585 [Nocardia sp. NPDC058058]|uniref:hypothetical protein n=1 Tax=Nocardia sp. NPDC058058 TaxID=3346317 RepID=UPI0036DD5A75
MSVPPQPVPPPAPEARGALDDPRLGVSDAAEVHLSPKRLLGPMGLGSASLLVNLPPPDTLAISAPPRPAPSGVGRTPPPPLRPRRIEQTPAGTDVRRPEATKPPESTAVRQLSHLFPRVRALPVAGFSTPPWG